LSSVPPKRIRFLRLPVWIGYSRAHTILARLDALVAHPPMHRMPNLLIVGRTNNGKTMIIDRFLESQKRHTAAPPEVMPIVSIQAPPKPEEKRFYGEIVKALTGGTPGSGTAHAQLQVVTLLRAAQTKMLIIDEIHHILAGHIRLQSVFLNALKYLSNELRIPIVAVGTKDALRAIQTDPQMANRFEPAPVAKWMLDEEFRRLLVSFERVLPLQRPSGLAMGQLPLRLLAMCEGQIGELRAVLVEAAIAAIATGKEALDSNLLKDLPWVLPSERRAAAERAA
jgi:hypothetical protein